MCNYFKFIIKKVAKKDIIVHNRLFAHKVKYNVVLVQFHPLIVKLVQRTG